MLTGDSPPQTVGGAGKIPDGPGGAGGGGGGGGGEGGGGGGAGGSAVSGVNNKISIDISKGGGDSQIHYHYYQGTPPRFRSG